MKSNQLRKPIFDKIASQFLIAMPYNYPGRKIDIIIETQEFTCLCPWSGLPDFADLNISYTPNKKVIELKSLKYYIQSYRQVGILHEDAVNKIMDDLVNTIKPTLMSVKLIFNPRGGIKTTVAREYRKGRKAAQ